MKATVAPYETAAWCVRVECTNGTIVRLTTYPFDLTMSNAQVYLTDAGYEQTAYQSNTSMAPSAIDLDGIAGVAGISRDEIVSGVFDNASIKIFKCDFLSPVEDYEPITAGFFGKTTFEDERYRVEAVSLIDAMNQSVGKTYTAACSHTFGDSRCDVDTSTIDAVGTVTHVIGPMAVRDSSRAETADWFGAGTISFTSGNNAGLKPLEIKSYAADGTITTFEPFYYAPAVSDTFVLIPGCRKRLEDCRDKWNNVVNFFGFTNMPTQSIYQQVGDNR